MPARRPAVTIGMPLYNNATTVARALQSLLSQSFDDIALVISDDASSDATTAICAQFARSDHRIRLTRQTTNLGYLNFRHVLLQAESPYFMWAAGDDWWEPMFVERCLQALDADRGAVAAVTRCQFHARGAPLHLARGTYGLTGTPEENVWRYLSAPRDNTRMYGLFRTGVAQASFPEIAFHAYDWAFSAATLMHGRHVEIPEVLLHRDRTPPERYVELVRRDARSASARLFPLLPMTRWLLARSAFPRSRRVLGALLALNLEKHREYAERYLPRYSRLADPLFTLWSRVSWRLTASGPE